MGRWPTAARAAFASILLGVTIVVAQTAPPSRQQQQQQQTPPPPPRPSSPTIARVAGTPITQEEFDGIARPYFAQLRQQLGDGFTDELKKVANKNVLDELIKRVVLQRESQSLPLTERETDRILRQDPFFLTNGKFDEVKFQAYKTSPGSNYLAVLPQVQAIARTAKMDETLRARFTPTAAQLRAEFSQRSEQVRFSFLPFLLRDIQLDGADATDEEMRAYYAAHPDQFMKKAKLRLAYISMPLPDVGDSLRITREEMHLARGAAIADSLRGGAPLEIIAKAWGGTTDTGLLDSPVATVPGLGRTPELISMLAHADSDTTVRVIGPSVTDHAVVVGVITERQPRSLPPFAQVAGDVKRRADIEKKRTVQEKERADFYATNRARLQQPKTTVTRVVLPLASLKAKDPKASDVEKYFASHSAEMGATTLTDSLRALVAQRMTNEARAAEAAKRLRKVVEGWRGGKDVPGLARSAGGRVETVSFTKPNAVDSLFPAPLVDSLLIAVTASPGAVLGPRAFGTHSVVWHVDQIDTTYVPPYEQASSRVGQLLLEEKRRKDEEDARAYFESHKADYKTKPKFIVDYIAVPIPPADSVVMTEAELRAYYDTHLDAYKQDEQVRARHILIKPEATLGAAADARARALADSLLTLLRGGADFADMARRWSQDPGSGRNGGDLGFFPRGQMVPEFNDTAFALAPGQMSQLVKTQFGYHIIKVEEHTQAGTKPYTDVRADIRFQLASARGDSLARKAATEAQKSLARGGNADALAQPYSGVKTSTEFAASDPVPGLGFVQGLSADIATLGIGKWSPVYKENTHYVVVRPKERIPEKQAEFLEVKNLVTTDAQTAKKREVLNARIAAVRAKLREGASLDSVAMVYGGLKDSGPLSRTNAFVPFLGQEPRVVDKAFALSKGQVSDTLNVAQGSVIFRVDEHTTIGGASFEKDRANLLQEIVSRRYDEWLQAKKKKYRIEILRADLREAAAPPKPQVTITPSRTGS